MGIETMKYKIIGWMVSAFFCGLAGGIMGGLVGYIDSTDVAFDGREMGVFMVLMAILGGKGTLWGPIIGATVFHIFKEGFWTFFLGWQYVALGVLIVVIVIYFPEGVMGWLREKYPERFGEVVDEAHRVALQWDRGASRSDTHDPTRRRLRGDEGRQPLAHTHVHVCMPAKKKRSPMVLPRRLEQVGTLSSSHPIFCLFSFFLFPLCP